jgi:hypothetical protein
MKYYITRCLVTVELELPRWANNEEEARKEALEFFRFGKTVYFPFDDEKIIDCIVLNAKISPLDGKK